MNRTYMSKSLLSIREDGFRVLLKELGPVGTVDFLRQLENGTGNYTEERISLYDRETIDSIASRIFERNKESK